MFFMIYIQSKIRCPNCRAYIFSTGDEFVKIRNFRNVTRHCQRCGRDMLYVWPFQYKFKPDS